MIKKLSPNFGSRNGFNPEFVVVHIMAGTLLGTDTWFASTASQVSAHYGIGFNGEIHQYVEEKNVAWAVGRVKNPTAKVLHPNINPNQYSISIEHEGQDLSKWTDSQLKVSADLIKDICTRHKIPIDRDHIIGHYEVFSDKPNCPAADKSVIDKIIKIIKGGNTLLLSSKEDTKKQIISLLNQL